MKKKKHTLRLVITVFLICGLIAGCAKTGAPQAGKADSQAAVTDSGASSDVESAAAAKEDISSASPAESSAASAESSFAESTADESTAPSDTESAIESFPADTEVVAAQSEEYVLKKVVVLSRHNIRSPISGAGSLLGSATPHEWFNWTSDTSQLSLRGGVLETIMGQYFRKWLESEGIFPENCRPEEGQVRFYANAKQRTQATARYFATGMFPVAEIEVEEKADFDSMDEVFTPKLHFVNDAFEEDAMAEIAEMGGEDGLAGLDAGLADAYALLEEVLDLKESDAYKNGELTGFTPGDVEITLNADAKPAMTGTLKTATSFCDALILQYYEEPDELKASFGHELTWDDWLTLSSVKETYQNTLFTAPSVAVNTAAPLLEEILGELRQDGRLFTFLCGHDSNLCSVLSAMNVKEYALPDTVEPGTPIGSKVVFELYDGPEDQTFCKISMMYQTTAQIRSMEQLTLENPPAKYSLEFEGIEANADGYFALKDIEGRIGEALEIYDEYAAKEALAPAA